MNYLDALHASAPEGYKCSDCTMDKEPCPLCYEAWWKKRHPHTTQHNIVAFGLTEKGIENLRAELYKRYADLDKLAMWDELCNMALSALRNSRG